MLGVAESKFGFKFRIGYESEFMLLRAAEPGSALPFRAVDNSVYASSSALNDMAPGKHKSEDVPLPPLHVFMCGQTCVCWLRGITGAQGYLLAFETAAALHADLGLAMFRGQLLMQACCHTHSVISLF